MFDKRIMEKQYTDEFVYGGACCMDGIKDIAIRDVNAPTYVGEAIDKLKILESNWEMGLLHIAEIPMVHLFLYGNRMKMKSGLYIQRLIYTVLQNTSMEN